MIITGAGGTAKELFEILQQLHYTGEIFFFDDVNNNLPTEIFGAAVLTSIAAAQTVLQKNNNFVLGLGNPHLREKLYQKFTAINGELKSLVSPFAHIGKYGIHIGEGCNIMAGSVITNSVTIGRAALININVSISHDCHIGDFAEISPGAVITGRSRIGDYTVIGANATILPDIVIGNNVVVGAGAVVTKNIEDNMVVAGVPAKPLNKIS